MPTPSVIIDLSPIARMNERNDWNQVLRVAKAWKDQKDPDATFYGVADNSLRYVLDERGKKSLQEWQRKRLAKSVSFADPVVLELAEEHRDAIILTTDKFRDHRRTHPWLQGSTRFYRPVIEGDQVTFEQLDYSPIPEHEISMRVQDADLKPRGMTSPEARQALHFEWSCRTSKCSWSSAPVIDDDPAYRDGAVLCPACREPATKAGDRQRTREIVVLLDEDEADRIPVAEGTSLIVGRGRGANRYDVRPLMSDEEAALVSRDHLRVANDAGRLEVEELGSKNGTDLIRPSATTPLQPGVLQRLLDGDQISLAAGAMRIRPSGKKRAHGRYAPDLTIAPWLNTDNEKD